MSQNQAYSGTTFVIPETEEVDWGEQVTDYLVKMARGNNSTSAILISQNIGIHLHLPTVTSVTAAMTLTQTHPRHKVAGDSAARTLSATTAIADGSFDGQELVASGNSASNTVTIPDGANTRLNGNITLGLGDSITLIWDSTDSNWWEISRSQ